MRLELLKDFLESNQELGRIVCTPDIAEELLRFGVMTADAFPKNFRELTEIISTEPTWFLAGSDTDTSLITCLIQQSDQGFSLNEYSAEIVLDGLFVMGSEWPPAAAHRFDLRPLHFSREQGWLLSLIGTDALLNSDLFDCETVGIVLEEGLLCCV
jgi:hypothetical protein